MRIAKSRAACCLVRTVVGDWGTIFLVCLVSGDYAYIGLWTVTFITAVAR